MVKELNVQGVYPVKTYFYIDDKTQAGFVIDPGAEPEKIYKYIQENDWKIEKILLTHGHMDHIGAVEYLQKELNVPVLIHGNEEAYLKDGYLNLSDNFGETIIVEDYLLFKDDEIVRLIEDPDFSLRVIHTPGHTPGSVIFYSREHHLAFIGDLLFEHGIGLTHFPGGDLNILNDSVKNILFSLPSDTILYSGHAAPITIERQKALLERSDEQ